MVMMIVWLKAALQMLVVSSLTYPHQHIQFCNLY